jgi:GNAT superfamily N-acetyltransferase
MPLQTRALDLSDDAQLRRFHEIVWRAEMADGRPWNTMWTFEEMTGTFRDQNPEGRTRAVATWDGDAMVGAGWIMMSDLDNTDSGWCFVAVEPEHRGRNIGSRLLDGIVAIAREENRTKLTSDAAVPFEERDSSPVLRWAGKHDFTVANVEIQRDLPLPVADRLLDEIADEVRPHHGDYRIETCVDEIPDELLPSWCELASQFVLEAPMGDLDFEAQVVTPEIVRRQLSRNQSMGRTTYFGVAVHGDQVVARSDLSVTRGDDDVHQWTTLVDRKHRGHRLGMALKVANLRRLAERQPGLRRVITTNAEVNQWMVAINERLGFQPVSVVPSLKRLL